MTADARPTLCRLDGKRILVTQADIFMGPVLCEVFARLGADVIADSRTLDADPLLPQAIVDAAGRVDVLVAHLATPAPTTRADQVEEDEWRMVFAQMVDPLPRLLRAVVPQMRERGRGKLLVIGSASALRGIRRASSYSAARGAQLAWVQAVGVELAADGIQVNAIAQNFVDNPTYFPPEVQANEAFQQRLKREVPLGRLVSAEEDALLAAYLCSDAADCFVGQVFPISGGWATR
ncbi:SDR family oxidoreductase [Piscinibacter sakaiensis]|uniref:SDR family oxidoreductase n=1 Tax=Piscinibacter sakaiensis TaxID=1547922 RepID=UPI003AB00E98